MKRIIALAAVLTLLLTMSISTPVMAAPDTWYVDDDFGGGDFETISAAIDAASPSDTIIVREGEYHEQQLGITKSNLTLTGEPGAILCGPGYEINEYGQPEGPEAIYVSPVANSVTIEGLSFQDYRSAIVLDGSNDNLIQNNTLLTSELGNPHSFYDGINLANAGNNQIIGNEVTDCEIDGIWLGPQCDEYGNRYGPGSNNNVVSGNVISGCHGGIILDFSHYNQVLWNTVSDSLYEPDPGCGIFIGVGASYNLVNNNQISNCGGGINLGYALFNEITENTIGNSDTGICMGPDHTENGPSNNTIGDNHISGCHVGMWLMNAQYNQVFK